MARAEGKVTVDYPAESLFEFILDGTNNVLWRPLVTDIAPLNETPYGVGSVFKQGLNLFDGRADGDYKITECQPNKLIRFVVTTGPIRYSGAYKFTTIGRLTTITLVLELYVGGNSRSVERMVDEYMQAEIAALPNLKLYLEKYSLIEQEMSVSAELTTEAT